MSDESSAFQPAATAPRASGCAPELSRLHLRRLRQVYRSAGWPCLDSIELDLLAVGWLIRDCRVGELERMRVSDLGLAQLAATLTRNRAAFDSHEALVAQVALAQARAGRLTYTGLKLRANVDGVWKLVRPDVYSIRPSPVPAYQLPLVHEIKVRRADLLGELRHPTKRACYLALAAELYYVFPDGLAAPSELPPECGVIVLRCDGLLETRRQAQRQPHLLSTLEWLELARATPLRCEEELQLRLGDENCAP